MRLIVMPIGVAVISVKVVPGASRDRVVGWLGSDLKLQVVAPPEGGKANQSVVRVLAAALGAKTRQVRIVNWHAQARKIVEIGGLEQGEVDRRLAAASAAATNRANGISSR
jgi:uncharacterized protein (TIGR00251 family)